MATRCALLAMPGKAQAFAIRAWRLLLQGKAPQPDQSMVVAERKVVFAVI